MLPVSHLQAGFRLQALGCMLRPTTTAKTELLEEGNRGSLRGSGAGVDSCQRAL